MLPSEVSLFKAVLRCSTRYLEFGIGGSTFLAAQLVKGSILTVESDLAWIENTRAACETVETLSKITFTYADIGPTRHLGYPADYPKQVRSLPAWARYHDDVWSIPEAARSDTVLVDGRFRVACALQTLLHCDDRTVMMVHDYALRSHYHIIEPFIVTLAQVDQLIVTQRKPGFNAVAARRLLDRVASDPE